ncbi:molybdate ABC transporter substrate-binding protein [Prauserella marina]|uniref:Molybdate transport system substrate-binding protein n=1 Tax=Prauserella marina TaxID=530584 RepID=A0A222VWC9_9PSEU|nr:molybdate ABC transporter substrate-binding protein [Prauserella marina]ASR38214.1 molybdate ABC transporter substrate-binding protein [Prauserella marina]PWV78598.1 molybdate transport system substrate-binding protein [Prauserella marina]SDC89640.1 molybdate transport system substrate-binding protein [Prauserella marina]
MRSRLAAVLGAVLVTSACGAASQGGQGDGTTLNVFAAASLTESFGVLEKRFEDDNPGVDVKLNLAGSSKLVQQIQEGAPADVFASADEKNMDKAVESGDVEGEPTVFATNTLTIAVPKGNPKGITSFADLAKEDLTVIVCAPQVPCGSATEKVEQAAGVALSPASEEQDVKAVLTKVEAGEADAGLVYVTDVNGRNVDHVDFPEADEAVNRYPIAVLAGSSESDLAARFTELVLGEAGRQELGKAGFGSP